jgi:tetratricopeptide (TPR) repeat protein
MRIVIILCIALFATGCALLQKTDRQLGNEIAFHINDGNYAKAYYSYNRLSDKEKNGKAVKKRFKQLQSKITKIRETTNQTASQAIEKGDWKKATTAYKKHEDLIEVDTQFRENYNLFVRQHEREKEKLNNNFLIVRADYLIKKMEIMQSTLKIDPYNLDIKDQIHDIKEESILISAQLLKLGVKAIRDNDISTARKLIPLAKQLDASKEANKASAVLGKITRPLDKYITRLTNKGNRLYSDEEYKKALEVWNDILFLDPNNKKVQANLERTEKVLESLKKIKRNKATGENNPADNQSKDPTLD